MTFFVTWCSDPTQKKNCWSFRKQQQMSQSIFLSPDHFDKVLKWFELSFKYDEITEEVVFFLITYFPTKKLFDENLPLFRHIAIGGICEEDRKILDTTEKILNKKNKSSDEKLLMNKRANIRLKIGRSVRRLRNEMFPTVDISGSKLDVFLFYFLNFILSHHFYFHSLRPLPHLPFLPSNPRKPSLSPSPMKTHSTATMTGFS